MTHAKNSTTPTIAQEAPLTEDMPFFYLAVGDGDSNLLQVCAGKSASEALSLSSMLLHSAVELMERLTEHGMSTNEIYGIRFLIDASATLIDASACSIEHGNRQVGAQ
ncbi:hypothetical protein [Pseudomonas sp.]|uniref:hypothetical protein n=1 Tax=Pseudomonas sp. TaxID=306 RepID=UPI003FD7C609